MTITMSDLIAKKHDQCKELFAAADELQKAFITKGVDPATDPEALSLVGAAWAKYNEASDEYKALTEPGLAEKAQTVTSRLPIAFHGAPLGVDLGRKREVTPAAKKVASYFLESKALDGTSGGTASPRFMSSLMAEIPNRPALIRALIPTEPCTGGYVEYLKHTVRTNNAAVVAPLGTKPTSVTTVSKEMEPVYTVAHISEPTPRQLLRDLPTLEGFIEDELVVGVLLAEDNLVLNGVGTTEPTGVYNTSGTLALAGGGGESIIVSVRKALTLLELYNIVPDAIVMHPTDWQTIAVEQTPDGMFIMGGPVNVGAKTLWDVPVKSTPANAQGTVLVGNFAVGTKMWERGDQRVAFNEGSDEFETNSLRFLAEESIAFAVVRPNAFCVITLDA